MKKLIAFGIIISMIFSVSAFAQRPKQDKGFFKEYEPGYYQNHILKDVRAVEENKTEKKVDKKFLMDQSMLKLPNKLEFYKDHTVWHQPSISQGNGGTCWCFSTISFFESEIYRLHKKEIKLSEMYIVYWEYVEKARRFIQERGNSAFSEGSEANAVTRIFKMYGAMPWSVYNGLKDGRKFHSHAEMFKEMNTYLKTLKTNNAWNEEEALKTIKAIMNHYIGEPPTEFMVDGKKYTPKTYLKDDIKIIPDDYVDVTSYLQEPYWKQVEYKVPDNWWHSEDYYNVPLELYTSIIKKSLNKGYSVCIGGDVSEAGFSRETNVALIPKFDIPSEYIDENARQFRFSNNTTTDDHGMHIVGFYVDEQGETWYLVKDSSSGSRNNDENAPEFGYYFFHEDYVKLKMMDFMVHKDMFKDLFEKFK
ncbi:MAG: hypothetical protein K9J13_05700 [Saprospiraceae bacterium]|nr:hypothetical protein [Saprospiraceae bacterium]